MKTIRLSFAQSAEDKVPYNQSEQCMDELIQTNQCWDVPPPNITLNIWSDAVSPDALDNKNG